MTWHCIVCFLRGELDAPFASGGVVLNWRELLFGEAKSYPVKFSKRIAELSMM